MKLTRKAALLLGCVLLGTAAAPVAAQPVADRGSATLRPEGTDANLQWAASVTVVNDLRLQGDNTVKLFGTASGDPAMNGLYTHLAFFVDQDEGWRVFRIGDFLDYRVVTETRGRVVLAIHESVMDRRSNISSRRRQLIVTWTPGRDGAPPTSVTVRTAPAARRR